MAKKKRRGKIEDPGKAAEFHVNPFADLAIELPKEPEPAPSPKPKEPASPDPSGKLSPEDRELLEAFGETPALDVGALPSPKRPSGPRLHFAIQRKGRGGKTVTRVGSFKHLSMLELMVMLKEIKRELGVGGTVEDDILELQGDQRQRAAEWFGARGYRVPG
ncbi:MAG: hypothetical protein HN742_24980 [Lentisphaerae bacterium]|jgi:translation initiation factor 1 (eIF-1/SUI1)|nr:hypothetical protein [Lentisphaerota bacterium]MBT4814315.1 hypothetical protein [Lentisphaerota bacterium]MBT5607644.1 hypothetical protein [Lentisphaerota bacterium]MBT7054117.1 hypothetical protein [Lentisphaerota bacterium]MBT7845156.1 hypothetical protein [Lentisphaerota bacterium]